MDNYLLYAPDDLSLEPQPLVPAQKLEGLWHAGDCIGHRSVAGPQS